MSPQPTKIRLKKDQWLTGEGHIIQISKMTDQHLVNTLTYVENHAVLYEDRANQCVTMLEEAKWRKLR